MHELINKLAFSLFKKNSLEDCTTEEIENLARRYPYFSSVQLLLAAKQKQINHSDFEKQLNLTSLYVGNPLWLNYLLTDKPTILKEKPVRQEAVGITPAYEDAHNDEVVVENPRHQIAETKIAEEKTVTSPSELKVERAATKEDKLVFEPYYTVDYFASQGIKNKIEDKPQDRFGQQLKSFTEWLKTIRQMPPQQIAAMSDSRSEQKVVQLASVSIEDRNVETEAMAEVWIKQGHPEKAIDIYRKLSLLDPSKNSYFASLIESLKKN